MADLASSGAIIKPVLHKYLLDAQYPESWSVVFRQEDVHREPDAYFHPSSHPLMTPRQLYYYLSAPESWETWKPDYVIRLSMLMGTAVHDFVQMALKDLGYLVPPHGKCLCCGRQQPEECNEHGVRDEATGSRGHMDGVLRLSGGLRGFELKTSNARSVKVAEDGDLDYFREKWPYYYAQVMEYMRMSGLREFIVLFFGIGSPWDMREYHVPFDPAYSLKIERKYQQARTAKATLTPPPPCCLPKSKESRACPAASCPIKSL